MDNNVGAWQTIPLGGATHSSAKESQAVKTSKARLSSGATPVHQFNYANEAEAGGLSACKQEMP